MSDASELSHVTRQSPTRRALPRSQSQATHGRRPEAQIIALCLTCCCEKRTAVDQFTVLLLLILLLSGYRGCPLLVFIQAVYYLKLEFICYNPSPPLTYGPPASFPAHHGRSRSGIIEPRAAGVLARGSSHTSSLSFLEYIHYSV